MKRLLLALLALTLAGDARAACDCATSTKSPWCTTADGVSSGISGISYTAPNAAGESPVSTVSVTFGDPDGAGAADDIYVCGRFANGQFWVVAEDDGGGNNIVKVTATSPTPTGDFTSNGSSGGRHGFMYGVPSTCRTNTIDTRIVASGTGTLPFIPADVTVTTAPVVFYKAEGRATTEPSVNNKMCRTDGTASSTCVKYVASFTVVDDTSTASPCTTCADSDGDGYTIDEFPPAYADPQTRLTIDGTFHTNMQALDGLDLDATAVPSRTSLTFEEAARNVEHPEPDHVQFGGRANRYTGRQNRPFKPSGLNGTSYGRHYGVSIANFMGAGILRLFLDDWDWGWDGEATEAADEAAWFSDWESQLAVRHAYYSLVKWSSHLPTIASGSRTSFTRTTDTAAKMTPHGDRCVPNNCNIGGMLHGKKLLATFGAWAFGSSFDSQAIATHSDEFRKYVAGISFSNSFPGSREFAHFIEDHEVYPDTNALGTVLYYGMDFQTEPCSSGSPTQSEPCGNGMCRISANPGQDSHCAGGKAYPIRAFIGNGRTARLIATLLDAETIWNDDDYLAYGYTWWEGGRTTGPPNHTGGQYCSPDNPSTETNTWPGVGGDATDRDSLKNYRNDILDEVFAAYKDHPGLTGGTGSPPVAPNFTPAETINEDGGAQAYTSGASQVTDADSDALTCTPGSCTNGSTLTTDCTGTAPQDVTGNFTPALDLCGTAAETCGYNASDGAFSDSGTITFDIVCSANEAPVASSVGAPTWHDTDCSQRLRYVFASALGSNLPIPLKLTSTLVTYSQTGPTDLRIHRGNTGALLPHDVLTGGWIDTGISTVWTRATTGSEAVELYWKCPDTVAESTAVWQDFLAAWDLGDSTLPIDDLSGNTRHAATLDGSHANCSAGSCNPTLSVSTDRGTGAEWYDTAKVEDGLQIPSWPAGDAHTLLFVLRVDDEGNTFPRLWHFAENDSFILVQPDLQGDDVDWSIKRGYATDDGQWWSSAESPLGTVTLLGASLNAASASNDPDMAFEDLAGNTAFGVSETRTPVGAANAINGTAVLGNRDLARLDRPFDGVILFGGVLGAALTEAELRILQDGFNGDLAPQAESSYVSRGADLSVAAPGVLAGCTDPDGDPVTASNPTNYQPVNFASNLVLNTNGSMTVDRDGLANGNYSFDYTCSDGLLNDTATVSFVILESELGGGFGGTLAGGAIFHSEPQRLEVTP